MGSPGGEAGEAARGIWCACTGATSPRTGLEAKAKARSGAPSNSRDDNRNSIIKRANGEAYGESVWGGRGWWAVGGSWEYKPQQGERADG